MERSHLSHRLSKWSIGSLALISIFTLLLILRWRSFPIFLDIYYHLSTMLGFDSAGGIVTHDFWEFAPAGRPHLYPPLVHILMLLFYKVGFSPLFIARFFSFITFPLILLTMWWVIQKIFGGKIAFFSVVTSSIPYSFFVGCAATTAASLALVILILIFYSIESRKGLAGALLMGLAFYTHVGMASLIALIFLIYGAFRREKFRAIFSIVLIGIGLSSPWLWHLWSHKGYFTIIPRYENPFLEINPIIYLLAIFGVLICMKKRGEYYFFIALLIGMLPLLHSYRYRFFCAQGMLAIAILAGIDLNVAYERIRGWIISNFNRKIYLMSLPFVILFILTFFSPTIFLNPEKSATDFSLRDSTFINLMPAYKERFRIGEASIYDETFTQEIVKIINENTHKDDIIYCNLNYVGGMFSAFSRHASSSGMLYEVKPERVYNPIGVAKLIIWVKNLDGSIDEGIKDYVNKFKLAKIAESEIACIYKNPQANMKRVVEKAIIPASASFAILGSCLVLICWDLNKS